ncbi:hypothetical protein, partial [Pseudomonas sp. NMI542_15]|uniref:hypothetical protein n=1 Tax=Pseudomonas sp. NMI542_15 TaxID=2903148 RepID=UPI001E4174D3
MGADGFGYFGQDQSNPPEGRKGDSAPPARTNVYTVLRPTSQEAKSGYGCFGASNSPFAMVTLTHLFALTASHFLSDATKSNQKTLRSDHPAPAL